MEIRQLNSTEFEDSVSLSQYAFQYKLSTEDKEKGQERFKPERIWGIFENGALTAMLTLLPLEVNLQGRTVSMGGIAGVSTWPENRRQGLVAKLLSHTLETMNEAGQTLSFLHPFLIPFYRKFGWEIYCETKNYTIPVSKFPRKIDVKGIVRRDVREDLKKLEPLYERFASQYNGTLVRSKDWWEHSVLNENTHHAVFYSPEGDAEGYILYRLENRELIIREFVYLNEASRQALWTFLANHDSMVTGAALKFVPSDDILPFLLPDPRITQENHPYFMGRIVNAKAFVEEYSFSGLASSRQLKLFIEDQHAPWNHGLWEWQVTDQGTAFLEKIEGERSQGDVVLDIGTLTILLLGYKRPAEMAKVGRLTGSDTEVQWLEDIIPAQKTALFDFF
ncbi:enhanced intracellular survival protein Eis [Paenibacillus sp. NPDC058177]|uniref:GNAT family N-acetyltransferase n=1 Tax=Paenibacillus sp. NPDC058177 TaxID=3346369 RepID=UPI0036D75C0D